MSTWLLLVAVGLLVLSVSSVEIIPCSNTTATLRSHTSYLLVDCNATSSPFAMTVTADSPTELLNTSLTVRGGSLLPQFTLITGTLRNVTIALQHISASGLVIRTQSVVLVRPTDALQVFIQWQNVTLRDSLVDSLVRVVPNTGCVDVSIVVERCQLSNVTLLSSAIVLQPQVGELQSSDIQVVDSRIALVVQNERYLSAVQIATATGISNQNTNVTLRVLRTVWNYSRDESLVGANASRSSEDGVFQLTVATPATLSEVVIDVVNSTFYSSPNANASIPRLFASPLVLVRGSSLSHLGSSSYLKGVRVRFHSVTSTTSASTMPNMIRFYTLALLARCDVVIYSVVARVTSHGPLEAVSTGRTGSVVLFHDLRVTEDTNVTLSGVTSNVTVIGGLDPLVPPLATPATLHSATADFVTFIPQSCNRVAIAVESCSVTLSVPAGYMPLLPLSSSFQFIGASVVRFYLGSNATNVQVVVTNTVVVIPVLATRLPDFAVVGTVGCTAVIINAASNCSHCRFITSNTTLDVREVAVNTSAFSPAVTIQVEVAAYFSGSGFALVPRAFLSTMDVPTGLTYHNDVNVTVRNVTLRNSADLPVYYTWYDPANFVTTSRADIRSCRFVSPADSLSVSSALVAAPSAMSCLAGCDTQNHSLYVEQVSPLSCILAVGSGAMLFTGTSTIAVVASVFQGGGGVVPSSSAYQPAALLQHRPTFVSGLSASRLLTLRQGTTIALKGCTITNVALFAYPLASLPFATAAVPPPLLLLGCNQWNGTAFPSAFFTAILRQASVHPFQVGYLSSASSLLLPGDGATLGGCSPIRTDSATLTPTLPVPIVPPPRPVFRSAGPAAVACTLASLIGCFSLGGTSSISSPSTVAGSVIALHTLPRIVTTAQTLRLFSICKRNIESSGGETAATTTTAAAESNVTVLPEQGSDLLNNPLQIRISQRDLEEQGLDYAAGAVTGNIVLVALVAVALQVVALRPVMNASGITLIEMLNPCRFLGAMARAWHCAQLPGRLFLVIATQLPASVTCALTLLATPQPTKFTLAFGVVGCLVFLGMPLFWVWLVVWKWRNERDRPFVRRSNRQADRHRLLRFHVVERAYDAFCDDRVEWAPRKRRSRGAVGMIDLSGFIVLAEGYGENRHWYLAVDVLVASLCAVLSGFGNWNASSSPSACDRLLLSMLVINVLGLASLVVIWPTNSHRDGVLATYQYACTIAIVALTQQHDADATTLQTLASVQAYTGLLPLVLSLGRLVVEVASTAFGTLCLGQRRRKEPLSIHSSAPMTPETIRRLCRSRRSSPLTMMIRDQHCRQLTPQEALAVIIEVIAARTVTAAEQANSTTERKK